MTNSTLYINEQQVISNIEILRKDKKACLMVKAQNYGVDYEFIETLVKNGYDYFGVSTIEEARIVRKKAPNSEILIVAYVDPQFYSECITNNYTVTVYNEKSLVAISSGCKYHLKFDTGMGRIGFSQKDIAMIKEYYETYHKPSGIFTHAPMATNQEFTKQQIELFREIVNCFTDVNFEYIHFQNSVGCQLYELDFVNMVRPGLGIWGYYADSEEKAIVEKCVGETIKPALSLYAKVHMIKDYTGAIGYDLSETVSGKIATIRLGYHDGFSRTFTGYEFNNKSKVVGKVCMCQCFMEIPEKVELTKQEIFGPTEDIYDLVNYTQKTIYEFLVSLSTRIIKVVE